LFLELAKLKKSILEKERVAEILGICFCDPPLDIQECHSVVREDTVYGDPSKVADNNSRVGSVIEHNQELINDFLENQYCYKKEVKEWFKFKNTHWEF
jgi:hypothetical protein